MNMREYPILHLDTNINEHERVSNITLRHKQNTNIQITLRTNEMRESIQYYTQTQM